MKDLIFLGGPMGVGKTAAARLLRDKLAPAAFLDGDWCWDMAPFVASEENKAMVLGNIAHLLRAFLENSGFEAVVFCWVMDHDEIIRSLLDRLPGQGFRLWSVSLTASPEELRRRVEKDIAAGLRRPGAAEASLARLPLYEKMDTIKLDTTSLTPAETAEALFRLVRGDPKGEEHHEA